VDEAILRADRILLMTNGPGARIAEIVVNTLPRSRSRHTIHKEAHYYPIRNHLVDFLVSRSKLFNENLPADYDPKYPPVVKPGLEEAVPGVHTVAAARPAEKAVVVNLRH
jgi:nitrate/nitrite transport system ATP-binding protein